MTEQIKVVIKRGEGTTAEWIELVNSLASQLNAKKIDYIPPSLLRNARAVIHYEVIK